MFQYFVGKLLGELPPNFNFLIGKKVDLPFRLGYYDLHDGINKKTEEEVSIFIYSKRSDDSADAKKYASRNLNYSKKLIHPSMLKIMHTSENDRRIFVVTEKCRPLVCHKIIGDPIWGIYEIMKTVEFMHSTDNVHCLINPLTLFINEQGRWKLGSFDLVNPKGADTSTLVSQISRHLFYDYGYRLSFPSGTHATYLDGHGLCLVIAWAYRQYTDTSAGGRVGGHPTSPQGSHLWDRWGSSRLPDKSQPSSEEGKEVTGCEFPDAGTPSDIFRIDLRTSKQYIPPFLHEIYDRLFQFRKDELSLAAILQDERLRANGIVKTMSFLSAVHMKSKSEKTIFFENLAGALHEMTESIKTRTILPELIQNIEVSENVLTCLKIILQIAKDMNPKEFQKVVYPTFLKYFAMTDRSIRFVLLENLRHIEQLLDKSNMNELYNFYTYGLTDNNLTIKNESIKCFVYVFPKLKKAVSSSAVTALLQNLKEPDVCIRTNTIICVAKIARHISSDRQNILDNVFQIGFSDISPQVRVITLESIKETLELFCPKRFVKTILPQIVRTLVDEDLQVRHLAFEVMDFALAKMRKEFLEDQKETGEQAPVKSSNFVDKLITIMRPRNEDAASTKANDFVDTQNGNPLNDLAGYLKEEATPMENVRHSNDMGPMDSMGAMDNARAMDNMRPMDNIRPMDNMRPIEEVITPRQLPSAGTFYEPKIEYPTGTAHASIPVGTHRSHGTSNQSDNGIFRNNKKESRFEETSLFNGTADPILFSSFQNGNNTNPNQGNAHSNISNNVQRPATNSFFNDSVGYRSNNNVSANPLSQRDLQYQQNQPTNSYNKHVMTKRKNRNIERDIDEFFDEFNLNTDNTKPKVKLSSLL